MRTRMLVRAMVLLPAVLVLLVLVSIPSPVCAVGCPPGQVLQCSVNPQTRREECVCVQQQQVVFVNSVPNSNLEITNQRELALDDFLPPSKWDQAPRTIWDVGPDGGTFYGPGGDTTVTVPRDLFPDGTLFTFVRPPRNALRRGTFVVRGAGDHIVDVKATNPSLDWSLMGVVGGELLLCFHISAQEVQDAGGSAYISIEGWNESNWVSRLRTTVYAPDPPAQPWWEFCVDISHGFN